ncbi:hypothetical protein Moror_13210 [Moniliophthora roreri MCA 2997]|uniref:F-box domain-containing protein n=1 Tax=Moniliophthora roreri (strain MCA 2997) TaxID=1381753 RepID=V2WPZ8_MONRO|nr:hypothetical protein Moror_13210 [Moniliophthora roreri MCA 2997]
MACLESTVFDFPAEIVIEFVKHHSQDHAVLAKCSLVSRKWRPLSQSFIFSTVTFSTRSDFRRWEAWFAESSDLVNYVRRVRCTNRDSWTDSDSDTSSGTDTDNESLWQEETWNLGIMPQVSELEWLLPADLEFPVAATDDGVKAVLRMLPNVKRIKVGGLFENWRYLAEFLGHWGADKLEAVVLDSQLTFCGDREDEGPESKTSFNFLSLKRLELSIKDQFDYYNHDWVLDDYLSIISKASVPTPIHANLNHLVLDPLSLSQPILYRLLQETSQTLKYLEMNPSCSPFHEESSFTTAVPLHALHTLHLGPFKITIQTGPTQDLTWSTDVFLPLFRAPCVNRVEISFDVPHPNYLVNWIPSYPWRSGLIKSVLESMENTKELVLCFVTRREVVAECKEMIEKQVQRYVFSATQFDRKLSVVWTVRDISIWEEIWLDS